MKTHIKNSADLSAAIVDLEQRAEKEKQQLLQNFHGFKESITPINLLKSTFTKVKETPGVGGSIVKAALGVGVGILSKNLIFGKAPGIVRKVVGSAVEMGLAGFIAKKSDTIKSTGSRLLLSLFRRKRIKV